MGRYKDRFGILISLGCPEKVGGLGEGRPFVGDGWNSTVDA